jgi:hypothetical protein
MSYAPYQRNTSGIVFFGEQGDQPTFYSDSNFLVQDGAAGHIKAPNLIIGDGGNIGSATDPDSISIASNGNVSISQSLSITGDLTVNGTTTTVNSTVVTIEDPIITLGQDSSSASPYGSDADDNKDRGIAFAWNDGNAVLGFFGHDDSAKGFTYIPSGSVAGEVFTGTPGWATFAGVSGNLAGNASTSDLATSITAVANDSTNETVYLAFVDGATGIQGIETDAGLTYNPSTNILTAGTFNGNLTGSATTLTNPRYIGASGHAVGSGLFDGSATQVPNIVLTSLAITAQTAEGTPDNDDVILIYDNTAGALRKQTRGEFVSGLSAGSMDSFQVKGDLGTTHTINDGNIFVLTGGSGIQVYGSGTDNLAINMKVDQSTLGFTGDVLEVQAIDTTHITAAALITAADTVATNDNDTSWPTTAAVIDYVASQVGGGGTMDNFIITDGSTPQTIDNGETITFADGVGAEFVTSATNTVTVNSVDSEIVHDNLSGFVANEHIDHSTVTLTAGAGLTGGGTVAASRTFNVIGGDGITVNADEVEVTVDNTTVELDNSNGAGAVRVKDSGITEAKRSRVVVVDTATSTIGATEDVSLVNSVTAPTTMTLPSVTTSGKIIRVKKTDSSANAVVVQRGGTSTIDGATTKILYSQYESITVVSDGTNWHII